MMFGEISDPLLAFIACYRKTGTARNIKTVLQVKFTIDQLKNAIGKLWDCRGTDMLGEIPERKDSKTRTAKEAYTDDLLNAFNALDECNDLPSFVVSANELHLVPRIHPEEIEMVSMAERLGAVEQTLAMMNEKMKLMAQFGSHVNQECESTWPKLPAYGNGSDGNRSQENEQICPNASMASAPGMRPPSSPSRQAQGRRGPTEDVRRQAASQQQPGSRSMAQVAAAIGDGDFTEVKKKPPRKRGKEGTSSGARSFKAGSDKFTVQITNVNPSVGSDDIKAYIKDMGVDSQEAEVKDTSTDGWPTKRYLITLPRDVFDKVMSPEFWPPKVYFSQFFAARGIGGKFGQKHG